MAQLFNGQKSTRTDPLPNNDTDHTISSQSVLYDDSKDDRDQLIERLRDANSEKDIQIKSLLVYIMKLKNRISSIKQLCNLESLTNDGTDHVYPTPKEAPEPRTFLSKMKAQYPDENRNDELEESKRESAEQDDAAQVMTNQNGILRRRLSRPISGSSIDAGDQKREEQDTSRGGSRGHSRASSMNSCNSHNHGGDWTYYPQACKELIADFPEFANESYIDEGIDTEEQKDSMSPSNNTHSYHRNIGILRRGSHEMIQNPSSTMHNGSNSRSDSLPIHSSEHKKESRNIEAASNHSHPDAQETDNTNDNGKAANGDYMK